MIEPIYDTFTASDGYPFRVTRWVPPSPPRGRVVMLHGVQSHGGWYHHLGRVLAEAGYECLFPDRRGSGANERDRGHASSGRRLLADVRELLESLGKTRPIALAGISWGGKLAVLGAARYPELVDAVALICPGLHPRVGVSRAERLGIFWALLTNRRKRFPIPLSDPALFTASAEGQAFIAADPLGLREATAALLVASTFLDQRVKRAPGRIRQPALLMLAGQDRIVNNERTRAYFDRISSRDKEIIIYPDGHHTLEFEPDPSRYAIDLARWLDRSLRSGENTRG